MKRNMSTIDRWLRALTGATLLVVWAFGLLSGGWALAAVIVAVIFLGTAAYGICPLYALLGIRSRPRQKL